MNQNSTPSYDIVSQAFHWLTAIAVTAAFILGPGDFGRLMKEGVNPATQSDIVWHESLGILILVMTLLRLIWVALRSPAPKFKMSRWMHLTGQLTRIALWILLLVLPATALMALGSESHPLTLLGGVRVNQIPWVADSAIAGLLDWGDVHKLLGDVIIWLAGLHATAAIFHHVFLKDGVLLAMLPWRK